MHSLSKTLARFAGLIAVSLSALAADAALSIDDPYVRLIPPGTTTTGAFMTIRNAGNTDRKLIKADSPVSDKVQLHTHMNENGVMKMREVPDIPVKAKGEVALKPGSYHIMLIDLKSELKEGELVPITLSFDDGSKAQVEATVRKLQMAMPASHGMKQGEMKH